MIEKKSQEVYQLIKDRQAWLDANNRSYNQFDFKELLTKLYSDSSHFVFELLQNAEDANATKVKFHLSKNK